MRLIPKHQNPSEPIQVKKSTVNFIQRLRKPQWQQKSIPDWENSKFHASHKMGSSGNIVFPLVQEINDNLIDFTNPEINKGQDPWSLAESTARINKDYVEFPTEKEAQEFGEYYKDYYMPNEAFEYRIHKNEVQTPFKYKLNYVFKTGENEN